MTSSDLIEMLREFEEACGGPVRVQVQVRREGGHNERFTLDQFDVDLDGEYEARTVLIDIA